MSWIRRLKRSSAPLVLVPLVSLACASPEELDLDPGNGTPAPGGASGTAGFPSTNGTAGSVGAPGGAGGTSGVGGTPAAGGTGGSTGGDGGTGTTIDPDAGSPCAAGYIEVDGGCVAEPGDDGGAGGSNGNGDPDGSAGTGGEGGAGGTGTGGEGGAGGTGTGGTGSDPCAPSCEGRCGLIADNCGDFYNCGMASCDEGQECTGGFCCTPRTCDDPALEGQCGDLDDGCGGTVSCGMTNCDAEETACMAGNCCAPAPCSAFEGKCGPQAVGCGLPNVDCGMVNCGPNELVCYEGDCCQQRDCNDPALAGLCGLLDDGCGGLLSCGMTPCTPAETVCDQGSCCQPLTCADYPADVCSDVTDGCGGTITCGTECPVFRVREYRTGSSSGTWNVTLDQPLERNYFAIVRGATGSNNNPDRDYVRISQDPHGSGQLTSGSVNDRQLRLVRSSSTNTWVGVVTVVECLRDCDVNGFELLDVRVLEPSGTSGSLTSPVGWGADLNRVMILGGIFGPGVTTSSSSMGNRGRKFFHFVPSGTNSIDWTRPDDGGTVRATTMVLRWGTAWNVQRRTVSGSSFEGSGAASAYDTAAITPVPRARTWVWGTGRTQGLGHGNSPEGSIVTLGTGASSVTNAQESSFVAVGQQANPGTKVFEVYALNHPNLVVDHRHRANGTAGSTFNVLTDDASGCPGGRMAINYTGSASTTTSNDWSGAIWDSRYSTNTNILMSRERDESIAWSGWIQGIQFCDITTSLE